MQGIRDMQMFESLTQCNWREYSTPGIPVSYFSIIHDDLTLYVPGVTSIPGTDYIGFLPTVTLSHHENCPTFVSFMYSNDGGRIIHNNIGSIIDPEKKNLFDNTDYYYNNDIIIMILLLLLIFNSWLLALFMTVLIR